MSSNSWLKTKQRIQSLFKYKWFLRGTDFILICLIYSLVNYLIPATRVTLNPINSLLGFGAICLSLYFFDLFKLYRHVWRYARLKEYLFVLGAACFSGLLFMKYDVLLTDNSVSLIMARTVLYVTLTVTILTLERLMYQISYPKRAQHPQLDPSFTRVLIIGAGEAGHLLVHELLSNPHLKKYPIGIIDDAQYNQQRLVEGIPVLGTRKNIMHLCLSEQIQEIIIAIPSLTPHEQNELLAICRQTPCRIQILPGVYESVDGTYDVRPLREVRIEDLLQREPICVDLKLTSETISDKVVLVTGGGGSIGSELCRQIATLQPKQLIILDVYENNAYAIQTELARLHPHLAIETVIASIRDFPRMLSLFKHYQPDIVFHAAAHKHVPLMEDSPQEAIKNNVFGTFNVATCASETHVSRFVLISTDKAVNPTNVMGATKRLAEMIIQSINATSQTDYVAVRFGNVLGSNGSVIPLFKKQIEAGGPVTVTHPEITRYFMTIPEAVQLVLQAGAMAKGGEIFILDMGQPVKIVDLAKDLITLSGYTPNVDIDITFTGLRPGEKMYEELLMAEEGLQQTENRKIFIGQPTFENLDSLREHLDTLSSILQTPEAIRPLLKKIVPTYQPEELTPHSSVKEGEHV